MDEREREQFEAWARTCDGNCNDRDIERRSDGDYHNMLVQRDWDVWQASRAALAPAQPSGWISVKDRLPDEPGDYLLFRPTAHLPPASNAGMTSPALNLTG